MPTAATATATTAAKPMATDASNRATVPASLRYSTGEALALARTVLIGPTDCAAAGSRAAYAVRSGQSSMHTAMVGTKAFTVDVQQLRTPSVTVLSLRSGPTENEREDVCEVAHALADACAHANAHVILACCLRLPTQSNGDPVCAHLGGSSESSSSRFTGTEVFESAKVPADFNILDGFVSTCVHALQFAGVQALLLAVPGYRCQHVRSEEATIAMNQLAHAVLKLLPQDAGFAYQQALALHAEAILPHSKATSTELMYA